MTFGVFSPTGHVVMGFTSDDAMNRAREALLAAGFNESSITPFSSHEAAPEIETKLHPAGIVASLSEEKRWMEQHLELANRGGGFLVVYGAHKYNRLTLTDLT